MTSFRILRFFAVTLFLAGAASAPACLDEPTDDTEASLDSSTDDGKPDLVAKAPCAVRGDGRLYCGNRDNAAIRAARSPRARQVNTLETTYSWFLCWGFGERHSGGNNTWYYTQGDDGPAKGWVAAVDMHTTSLQDSDPSRYLGLLNCDEVD